MFKLKQKGIVAQYQIAFRSLSNQVMGLYEIFLLNCFISGLKLHIRRELQIAKPVHMVQAVALAKWYECKYQDQNSYTSKVATQYFSSKSTRFLKTYYSSGTNQQNTSEKAKTIPVRLLTAEEM